MRSFSLSHKLVKTVIILLGALVIALLGIFFYLNKSKSDSSTNFVHHNKFVHLNDYARMDYVKQIIPDLEYQNHCEKIRTNLDDVECWYSVYKEELGKVGFESWDLLDEFVKNVSKIAHLRDTKAISEVEMEKLYLNERDKYDESLKDRAE